jgi:hypothetical protein
MLAIIENVKKNPLAGCERACHLNFNRLLAAHGEVFFDNCRGDKDYKVPAF